MAQEGHLRVASVLWEASRTQLKTEASVEGSVVVAVEAVAVEEDSSHHLSANFVNFPDQAVAGIAAAVAEMEAGIQVSHH